MNGKVNRCEHEKVYEQKQLLTAPPKIRWICKKCLVEGIDTLGTYEPDEYTKLKNEKDTK